MSQVDGFAASSTAPSDALSNQSRAPSDGYSSYVPSERLFNHQHSSVLDDVDAEADVSALASMFTPSSDSTEYPSRMDTNRRHSPTSSVPTSISSPGALIEGEDIPTDVRSRLHTLSDFKVTFALNDVASLLKYVIDEVQLLKAHSAREYVHQRRRCQDVEDVCRDTTVRADAAIDATHALREQLQAQAEELRRATERADAHERDLRLLREEMAAVHAAQQQHAETLAKTQTAVGSLSPMHGGRQLGGRDPLHVATEDGRRGSLSLMGSTGLGSANSASRVSSPRMRSPLSTSSRPSVDPSAAISLSLPPTCTSPSLGAGMYGDPEVALVKTEITALNDAVKSIASQQQIFNRYVCRRLNFANKHTRENLLRPDSAKGCGPCSRPVTREQLPANSRPSTRAGVFSNGRGHGGSGGGHGDDLSVSVDGEEAASALPQSEGDTSEPACLAAGCDLASAVVHSLAQAPSLLGIDPQEAARIRASRPGTAANDGDDALLGGGASPSGFLVPLGFDFARSGVGAAPPARPLSATTRARVATIPVLSTELSALATRLDKMEQRQGDAAATLSLHGSRLGEYALRSDQQVLLEQMNALVLKVKAADDTIDSLRARLDGEMVVAGPVDGGALRRSVVALNAKVRQLQDKVDTVSALSLSTRKQLSQIGSFETSSLAKSLSLRVYEGESAIREMSDKLIMLAHYVKQMNAARAPIGASNGAVAPPTPTAATAPVTDEIDLLTRSSAIDTILQHKRPAPGAATVQQHLTDLVRDVEALADLQTRLQDARALLSRLEDLTRLDSKVQSLLDLDLPERLAFIERRVNTEVSFLKAHLAGKVDQGNLRAVLAMLGRTPQGAVAEARAYAVAPSPLPSPSPRGKAASQAVPSSAATATSPSVRPATADEANLSAVFSALSSKADGAAVDKLEELVRALDRQTRDALVKLMSEMSSLRSQTERITADTHKPTRALAAPSTSIIATPPSTTDGPVDGLLQGPFERLEQQLQTLAISVASHEAALARKCDTEWVEDMRESLLTYVDERAAQPTPAGLMDASDGSGALVEGGRGMSARAENGPMLEVVTRLHGHMDEVSRKVRNHREWIARNAQDIQDIREWVRFAHEALKMQAQGMGGVRALEAQVERVKRLVTQAPGGVGGVGRSRTVRVPGLGTSGTIEGKSSTLRVVPASASGTNGDVSLALPPLVTDANNQSLLTSRQLPPPPCKCLSCDRPLQYLHTRSSHALATGQMGKYVCSVCPAGGMNGTHVLKSIQTQSNGGGQGMQMNGSQKILSNVVRGKTSRR